MAIIGKIRSNSTLVVGVVAGALILFVLGDLIGGRGSGGNGPDEQVAGEVFGTEISTLEYERKVAEQINGAKQNNPDLTEEQQDNIREDVWNQMVNRIIFDKELASFNFVITPSELNDLIFGNNIQEYVRSTPMFQNRAQQFSVDSVIAWRQRIERSPDGKAWWVNNLETPVKDNRRIGKYFNMIKQGLYVTTAEIEQNHIANNRKYKIRFITKSFGEIPDSTIKVTDEEIREYYEKNKNKKKYETAGSRAYSWVEFDLKPSEADKEEARKHAAGIAEQFKTAKNDSAFVMTYAETKVFNDQWSEAGTFPADMDSLVQKADSGTIIGPFLSADPMNGEFWKVVKVRDTKMETEVSARHILLRGDEKETKPRADSIIRVIRKNKNFEAMAAKFGTDGTKDKGGDLGWFSKGRMVPEFEKAAFEGKINDLQVVKTSFGVHILEVTGKREAKRVKAATIDVKVRPLRETDMAVRARAVEFLSNLKSANDFQAVAQKMKLTVKKNEIAWNQKAVDENPQNMYMGMGNQSKGGTQGGRSVAREIHRMTEGDVSPNPVIFNDKYIVIKLDNVKEKGVPEFEDVKEIMKAQVVIQKKGEQEAKKMKGAKSLEELSKRLNLPIKEGELSFSSNQFPESMGYENEVIGSVFAMNKPGDMSIPLKGKSAVYVVVITGITEAQPLKDKEKTDLRMNLTNMLRQRAQNDAYQAIRELAKIEDKRSVY
ncbi:MAG TPA: peptidyl-prolyl cis-trans isomerase [Flavobacteriales bacterium]|nr:peptidyl-prolyl cis-trans isomerase [Flavobacteriales bacterium]